MGEMFVMKDHPFPVIKGTHARMHFRNARVRSEMVVNKLLQ
jgi:hypothetical protein